jgi:hypothetical protein
VDIMSGIEKAKLQVDAGNARVVGLSAVPREDQKSKAQWNNALSDCIDAAWRYASVLQRAKAG